MAIYSKGLPGELSEIRDFVNMVFSMHRMPHNFEILLPKLYQDGQNTEAYHYLAKEGSKLKAIVCALPFSLISGKHTLSCAAIGSVSVHPYSRGKGYMKELMSWMQKDLKEQGVSLCVLEGRRHRYQYFG
ncbi:MAG: GNAT family N-acetyltransferase, partial [Hungatella sp.]